MKVLLKYKQSGTKPSAYVERFGMRVLEVQPGIVNYDQEEEVEVDKVNERIKELKSFSNRNYHSFSVKDLDN